MKITHNKIGQNLNLTDANRTDKSKQSSSTAVTDANAKANTASALKDVPLASKADAVKVDLSERAQDVRKVKEMALATPDVDQAKVEKFRKLIDEGKYKVDAKAVAERMVDEHMFNSGAANNE